MLSIYSRPVVNEMIDTARFREQTTLLRTLALRLDIERVRNELLVTVTRCDELATWLGDNIPDRTDPKVRNPAHLAFAPRHSAIE